nr:MAG TPA: hypothetical protein [Caudoviricetes sp.]
MLVHFILSVHSQKMNMVFTTLVTVRVSHSQLK